MRHYSSHHPIVIHYLPPYGGLRKDFYSPFHRQFYTLFRRASASLSFISNLLPKNLICSAVSIQTSEHLSLIKSHEYLLMFTENSSCSELSKISSTSSPYHQSLNKRSWYWVIFSHSASRRPLHRWNTTVYFCREITKLIKCNQMHPDIHLHWLKDTVLHGLFKILTKADFDWPYATECQMSRGHRIKIGLSDSLL